MGQRPCGAGWAPVRQQPTGHCYGNSYQSQEGGDDERHYEARDGNADVLELGADGFCGGGGRGIS